MPAVKCQEAKTALKVSLRGSRRGVGQELGTADKKDNGKELNSKAWTVN